jgi:hypothetical protein
MEKRNEKEMIITERHIKNILTEELLGYQTCQTLEDKQLIDYLYEELLLEKLLSGESISIPELRKLLRKKVVNFEFIKLDGTVRPSVGTTLMRYIPPPDHPKGIRPSSPKVATFYDLDKDAWRSVSRRSKEIVLKKDEETDKPIVVVSDKSKVKVKPVTKERESTAPIEQGKSYKYTTNRGTNTYVEIVRELPNGLLQVSSPVFKTTFAIAPYRIGDEFTPEEPREEKIKVKHVEPKEKPKPEEKPVEEPKVEPGKPFVRAVEKPREEPKVEPRKPFVRAVEKPKEPVEPPVTPPTPPAPGPVLPKTTVIIPATTPTETEEEETKAPPIDITPPIPPEEERPEELEKGP